MASTFAQAADLPSRRAPPVFVPPPPIVAFTWTGFYIGANAGYAFDEHRGTSSGFPVATNSIVNSPASQGTLFLPGGGNSGGFTGGGQIGFNYQFNPGNSVVIGVEADAQYLGLRGNTNGPTSNYTFVPTAPPRTLGTAFTNVAGLPPVTVNAQGQTRTDFFGTVRGRIGYAFDRFLPYGTGGFAYSNHNTGYAVGGGLEYSFTNNLSVGAEYLYVNLDRGSGSLTNGFYNAAANTVTFNTTGGRENFSVVRAKLNYRFDFLSPVAVPVVARY